MPARNVTKARSRAASTRPTTSRDALEQVYVPDRATWRRWLSRHHATSPGIWLVFDRASHNAKRLPYADAVEEALCFGWIDSTIRPLSETQYRQLFTPRKPKSTWSKLNKTRVAALIAKGRMHRAGLDAIERSKANGGWVSLDHVESLSMPPDLARALDAVTDARANFDAFAPSARKGYFHWISQAKRPETRKRRVDAVVALAAAGKRSRHLQPSSRRTATT